MLTSSLRPRDPLAALPFQLGDEFVAGLRDAVELSAPALFVDLAQWAQSLVAHRDSPASVDAALQSMLDSLGTLLPLTNAVRARSILEAARAAIAQHSESGPACAIDATSPRGAVAERILNLLLEGDEQRASRELLCCVAKGTSQAELYGEIITPLLHETGRLWEHNAIGISEEHAVTAAIERFMAHIAELQAVRPFREFAVVSASLGSSAHEVGARMLADTFALGGWHATYLGGNIPPEDLLDYVDRVSVDVLALSATLARDIIPIRNFIAALLDRPVAPLVLVGGRAFALDPTLWQRIGADGFAATPSSAVALANELVHQTA